MFNDIKDILGIVLQIANILVLAWAFFKFLKRPHDTMDARVISLEAKIKEIEYSLKEGNDKFRELGNAVEAITRSTLALIEFEIQYCTLEGKGLSEELKQARSELHSYLAGKR